MPVTYRHVKGKDNSFSVLLSRLIQGGKSYLPEGGKDAFVLLTSASSNSDSVTAQDLVPSLLQGELRSKLISLQHSDSSTLLHSESLKAWHDHFRANTQVSRLAAEAKRLGLVTLERGLLPTISDVDTGGAVFVPGTKITGPVIPIGQMNGLDELVSTNVHVDWNVRDWLLFVTRDLDYHRSARNMRDSLVFLFTQAHRLSSAQGGASRLWAKGLTRGKRGLECTSYQQTDNNKRRTTVVRPLTTQRGR
ncbi:hypothetical protein FOL47_008417 [Perkinsus chesapeaki]|uniref:Uncharacterized protein n=1 Tax=Perkinsus chesapeaki TaxID=330153 RepID=A0A7J6LE15_PERCH|nr:hypothetical protein FOL47_008417 [Perkinsus chesapeaki]